VIEVCELVSCSKSTKEKILGGANLGTDTHSSDSESSSEDEEEDAERGTCTEGHINSDFEDLSGFTSSEEENDND
jgi:hypothetical protein